MTFDIFEIKSSQTILSDQFKGLKFLQEIAQETVAAKTLIYGGSEVQHRSQYTVLGWNHL